MSTSIELGLKHEVPVFPLGSVLFPQGVLPLRIFETRYTDMVRECMRENRPFGVCLITQGNEVGVPADHEMVGCLARIVDFDMEQQGVLQIRTVGEQRFSIIEKRVDSQGLIRASVQLIANDVKLEIPDEFEACASLAKQLVQEIQSKFDGDPEQVIAKPYEFELAGWVANRLCEVLPIDSKAKQKLMELQEPLSRLSLVNQFLENKQVF